MNHNHKILLAVLILGAALAGTAAAGIVDPGDVAFVAARGTSDSRVGGNPAPWDSAGVVSRSDSDFVARDGGIVIASTAAQSVPPVGTVDGADYRLIAGDGSPGATCEIALVAAINPAC